MDMTRRPYERFVVELGLWRKQLQVDGRDTLASKIAKTVMNSLYGKIAQGVKEKNAFDIATGQMRKSNPSSVTNAIVAAHITGLVRAGIGEMLNSIPDGE